METKQSREVQDCGKAVHAEVSPEVETLARDLYCVGIGAMKGPAFDATACWSDMDPHQKHGWFAVAEYAIARDEIKTIKP